MGKVKIELNPAGCAALLKGEAVQAMLQTHADQAMTRLGSGYSTSVYVGRSRANVSIKAETRTAMRDNMANNTILKALK